MGERGGGEPDIAFKYWFEGIKRKYPKHTFKAALDSHPKYIKEKLLKLNEDQFGHSVFGLKYDTSFKLTDTIKGYKLKKTIQMKAY